MGSIKPASEYKAGDIIFYKHNPTSDYAPCLVIEPPEEREQKTGRKEMLIHGIIPEYYEVKQGNSTRLYVSYDAEDHVMKTPLAHIAVAQHVQDDCYRPRDERAVFFDPDEYYVVPTDSWLIGVSGDGWSAGDKETVVLSDLDETLPSTVAVASSLPETIKNAGVRVTKKRNNTGTKHFMRTIQGMQERKFFPLLLPNLLDGFKPGVQDDRHGTVFEHNILGVFPNLGWVITNDGEEAKLVMRWDGENATDIAVKAHKDFKKNTLAASISKTDGSATVTIKF